MPIKLYPANASFKSTSPSFLPQAWRLSPRPEQRSGRPYSFWRFMNPLRSCIATPIQNDQYFISGFQKLCIAYFSSLGSHRRLVRRCGCGPFLLRILQLSFHQTCLAGTSPPSDTRIQKEEKPLRSRKRQQYAGDRGFRVSPPVHGAHSKPRARLGSF